MLKKVLFKNNIFESIEIENTPEKIYKEISNGNIPISKSGIFPKGECIKMQAKLINSELHDIINTIKTKYSSDIIVNNLTYVSKTLNNYITECKSIENANIHDIEKECVDFTINYFHIPVDSITFNCNIVNDFKKNDRLINDEKDIEFEDSDTIEELYEEINKRIVINSIIEGISNIYSSNTELYVNNLYKINHKLPLLYDKITLMNNYLMFSSTFSKEEKYSAGDVDVYIYNDKKSPLIKSYGIIFPVLLNETIKGVLEIVASKFLPNNVNYAQYVIENSQEEDEWCVRFGVSIWRKIEKIAKQFDYNEYLIIPLFYELISFEPKKFIKTIKEIILGTSKSKKIINSLLNKIRKKIEMDDFVSNRNNRNKEYEEYPEFITDNNIEMLK